MPKISFCITCMNRLEHLKKTLLINITSALVDYENIEFVLLDYNSSDGLSEWVLANMKREIDLTILKYFQTFEPLFYQRSHSRNMAFRLASGDILVNIDADNFLGTGFVKSIIENMIEGVYMAVEEQPFGESRFKDVMGRICVWKKDFLNVRGYDENMAGYGFEDTDLKARLKKSGLKTIPIKKPIFLKSIKHDNYIRIENEGLNKNIHSVAVRQLKPFSSEVFFFFQNNLYEKATIIDTFFGGGFSEKIKVINKQNQVVIKELSNGYWIQKGDDLRIDKHLQISINDDSLQWFYPSDSKILTELIYTFSALKNKKKYFENLTNQHSWINRKGFGQGNVLKNFKEKIVV